MENKTKFWKSENTENYEHEEKIDEIYIKFEYPK